jgi:hypothetical protein
LRLAPCQPGASPVSVRRRTCTTGCSACSPHSRAATWCVSPFARSAAARRCGSQSTPAGASTSCCARGQASLPQGSLAPARVMLSRSLFAYDDPIRRSRRHATTSRPSRLEPVRKQRYRCLFSYRLLWPVRTHTMEPLFIYRALYAARLRCAGAPRRPAGPSLLSGPDVTFMWTMRRRSCNSATNTNNTRNVTVGTMKKSTEASWET